jgi:hypothetical protein
MKTLNVLTRTSGRPKFFKLCRQSVESQDYPNLKHILLVDDKHQNNYVYDYEGIDKIISIDSSSFEHYDQYLNEALKQLPKGELFCVMDDDDFYTRYDSLSRAVKALGDKDLVLFRVKAACATVPSTNRMTGENKYLEAGDFSMLGFVMKTDFARNKNGALIEFPARHGGDYGFINRCAQSNFEGKLTERNYWNNPKISWLTEVLASTHPTQSIGNGECEDLRLSLDGR